MKTIDFVIMNAAQFSLNVFLIMIRVVLAKSRNGFLKITKELEVLVRLKIIISRKITCTKSNFRNNR